MDQNDNGVIEYAEFNRVFPGKSASENSKMFERFSEGNAHVGAGFWLI